MTEFEKMIQLLDASWVMRSEIVPCLVGPPGIGKTAAVMQHAAKHGSRVTKIVASRCIPSETVGMTMPDHKNRSMTIYNSMQLGGLRDGDILFLDELLEADQFVLSTLLTVIESREMADGTPLPDIQIIAATNDTIPPDQLKGNIRQRFMFQRFRVDPDQTHDYIMKMTGIDVPREVLANLCSDGNDYNFLTPRSLTKLCMWIDATPADKLDGLMNTIDSLWESLIGTKLVSARQKRDRDRESPERQVRDAINTMMDSGFIEWSEEAFRNNGEQVVGDDDDIPDFKPLEECSFNEMITLLMSHPKWKDVQEILSHLHLKTSDDGEADISSDVSF